MDQASHPPWFSISCSATSLSGAHTHGGMRNLRRPHHWSGQAWRLASWTLDLQSHSVSADTMMIVQIQDGSVVLEEKHEHEKSNETQCENKK